MLRNAPTLLLLIMVASLAAACSSPSYDQKALEIAEAWSQNSVDAVTKEVADLVLDDSPALANLGGSILADQIQERINWDYSVPSCDSDGRCTLTATVQTTININVPLVMDKTVTVSFPFALDIDAKATVQSGVTRAAPQIAGGTITEE